MIGKINKRKVYIVALLLIFVVIFNQGIVFAEETTVRLDIDNKNLTKGVSTKIVITIENEKKIEGIDIVGLDNFKVLSTGQSTSTEVINGVSKFKRNIIYTVMAKNLGEFKLKGKVDCGGKSYETNEVIVKVNELSTVEGDNDEEIFLKTNISSKEIYFGEKLAVSYELYTRYSVDNFRFMTEVNIDEAITDHIPEEEFESELVYLNKEKYARYDVEKMYVSPVKTGTLLIPEYNFLVNLASEDIFSSGERVYLQTKKQVVTVKPLPEENKPDEFSGIVGELKVQAKYSNNEVNYGEAVNLKVTLEGSCNLDNIKSIIHGKIDGFDVYESEKSSEVKVVDGKYLSKKDFELIFVAEKTGDIAIEPMYINYFDTISKEYKRAEIKGTIIAVKGSMPEESISKDGDGNNEKILVNQVSYKMTDIEYFTIRIKKNHFWMLFAGIILLMIIIGVTIFISKGKKRDKELHRIYNQVKKTNDKNELYKIFNEIIKYETGISIKASSKDYINKNILDKRILAWVIEVMEYMEIEEEKLSSRELKDKIKMIYKIYKKI